MELKEFLRGQTSLSFKKKSKIKQKNSHVYDKRMNYRV